MSRLTITLDPTLLTQAQDALGAPSKAETIRRALVEAIRKHRLAEVLSHRGKIDLALDQESLARLREST
ncbi:MAG: hypothetical protein HC897_12410 [Thermoanaerobaculia bacterium]|nr:hypothetical protein [Thermoanaerobaculia bacterium]